MIIARVVLVTKWLLVHLVTVRFSRLSAADCVCKILFVCLFVFWLFLSVFVCTFVSDG